MLINKQMYYNHTYYYTYSYSDSCSYRVQVSARAAPVAADVGLECCLESATAASRGKLQEGLVLVQLCFLFLLFENKTVLCLAISLISLSLVTYLVC